VPGPADRLQRRLSPKTTPPAQVLPPLTLPMPSAAPPTISNTVFRTRQRPDLRSGPLRPPSTPTVTPADTANTVPARFNTANAVPGPTDHRQRRPSPPQTARPAPSPRLTAANFDRYRCRHRQHRSRTPHPMPSLLTPGTLSALSAAAGAY